MKFAVLVLSVAWSSMTWACLDLNGTYVEDGLVKTKVEFKAFQRPSMPLEFAIENAKLLLVATTQN